jgi:hypothetical protein
MHACSLVLDQYRSIYAFVGHAVCRKWPMDWHNWSRPIEKPTWRLAIWHVRINFDASSMVARGTEISVGPLASHPFQTEQGRTRPHFLSVGLLFSFFIIFFLSLRVRACASSSPRTGKKNWVVAKILAAKWTYTYIFLSCESHFLSCGTFDPNKPYKISIFVSKISIS